MGRPGAAGRPGRRLLQVVSGLASLCAATLVSVHAQAAPQGGLGVAPANPDPGNPATRSYVIADLSAGAGRRDAIRIANSGPSTMTYQVAAVDGVTAATSGAVYSSQLPAQRWGSWLTPDASSVTVPANQETTLGFSIQVPAGAFPGDHLGGIAVQSAVATADGAGVNVIERAVVGVLVVVPGPAQFHLSIGTATVRPVSPYDPRGIVDVPLTDDGLSLGKPVISVTLAGPNGYHATASRQLDTLLPGDTIVYPFSWPDALPAGTYQIDVHPVESSVAGTGAGATRGGSGVITPAVGPVAVIPSDRPAPTAPGGSASAAPSAPPVIVVPVPAPTTVVTPLAQIAQSVVSTSSFPLALLVLVGLFLAVQSRIDKRDPKLALAPAFADEDMVFQPLRQPSSPGDGDDAADSDATDGTGSTPTTEPRT